MKSPIQLQNDITSALNRIEIVFARVVDPKDRKSIEEFLEEKERIEGIILDQWRVVEKQ